MYDRENPSLLTVLDEDDTLPLDAQARQLWIVNLGHPLRRTVLHLTRMICSALLFAVWIVKRSLPFQFSHHDLLQAIICWFMKWFVAPEANALILRHFWVESNLINFVIANSRRRDVAPVTLYPETIADLMRDSFVRHDVALFNALHDLGSTEGEAWPVSTDRIDCSLMRPIARRLDPFRRRFTQGLDFETAHELFKTTFCLLVTADEYERSINSFQFDRTLAIRIARITGRPELATWAHNSFPLALVGPHALTYRFVMHGLAMEHLHAAIMALKSKSATSRC